MFYTRYVQFELGDTDESIEIDWVAFIQAFLHNGVLWATYDENDDVNNRSTVSVLKYDGGTAVATQRFGNARQSDYAFQAIMMDHKARLAFLFNTTKTSDPTLSGAIQISGFTGNSHTIQDSYRGNLNAYIDYSGSTIDPNGIDMWFVGTYHTPTDQARTKIIRVNFERKIVIPFIAK